MNLEGGLSSPSFPSPRTQRGRSQERGHAPRGSFQEYQASEIRKGWWVGFTSCGDRNGLFQSPLPQISQWSGRYSSGGLAFLKASSTKTGLWDTGRWWLDPTPQIHLFLPFNQRCSAPGPILAEELQVWRRRLTVLILYLYYGIIIAKEIPQKRHCILKSD